MTSSEPAMTDVSAIRVRVANLEAWSDHAHEATATLANGGTVTFARGSSGAPEFAIAGIPRVEMHDVERLYVFPLSHLVTLCLMAYSPPSRIVVHSEIEGAWMRHQPDYLLEAPSAPLPRANNVLLYLDDIGVSGVAAWLDECERLVPIPTVVAGTVPVKPDAKVPIETTLLQLTTVAEGLYGKLIDEPEPPMAPDDANRIREIVAQALTEAREPEQHIDAAARKLQGLERRGYKEGLRALVEKHGAPTLPALGNKEEWVKLVEKYRNAFAHARSKGVHTANSRPYEAITVSLRWFLISVLLQVTLVPPDVLRDRLDANEDYQWFVGRAPTLLPKVYAEATERPT